MKESGFMYFLNHLLMQGIPSWWSPPSPDPNEEVQLQNKPNMYGTCEAEPLSLSRTTASDNQILLSIFVYMHPNKTKTGREAKEYSIKGNVFSNNCPLKRNSTANTDNSLVFYGPLTPPTGVGDTSHDLSTVQVTTHLSLVDNNKQLRFCS